LCREGYTYGKKVVIMYNVYDVDTVVKSLQNEGPMHVRKKLFSKLPSFTAVYISKTLKYV